MIQQYSSPMIQQSDSQPFFPVVPILIAQFWLSGLWILSLIFTMPQPTNLQTTNFFMFLTLGIGSLVGGYISDIIGRIKIFQIVTVIWFISSVFLLIQEQIGYIISAGCIGLLNNITFVILMEYFPTKKDQYTIYVLIGWAVSQITLGGLFWFIDNKEIFYVLLFVLTLLFTVSTLFGLKKQQTQTNLQPHLESLIQENNQIQANAQTNDSENCMKKILPHSWKPLLGGCLLMFVMQMFYYRTQFTLDRFGISLQLNTIIVGSTQLIANVIFTRAINMFPRKYFLRIFLIILSVLFLGLVLFQSKGAQTFIEGIMRLFDTCIMIILGVYLPELFDPDERGKGTNYVMAFGVLGSALNSIILNSLQFWQLIFFLFIGFIATFLFKQTYPIEQKVQQASSASPN